MIGLLLPALLAEPPGPPPEPPQRARPAPPPEAHWREPWHGNLKMRIVQELQLNDKQIKKLDELITEFKKRILDIRMELDPLELKFKKFMLEDSPNLKEIEKILKKIYELRAAMRLEEVKFRLEFEKMLNDEQRTKLKMLFPRGKIIGVAGKYGR